MVVGIEKDLQGIKNYLESLGCYEVHVLGAYNGVMDAIIYQDENSVNDFAKYQFTAMNNALSNHDDISEGTLMIRAAHKTGEDIHELLAARCSN